MLKPPWINVESRTTEWTLRPEGREVQRRESVDSLGSSTVTGASSQPPTGRFTVGPPRITQVLRDV